MLSQSCIPEINLTCSWCLILFKLCKTNKSEPQKSIFINMEELESEHFHQNVFINIANKIQYKDP